MEAALVAARDREPATLALVVATEGSTYVRTGAMALFGARGGQVGWLSGGCLEPDIEARAQAAADAGHVDWMDLDTREDEDLLSGSAVGCRGRLNLALLPLRQLPGWERAVAEWLDGQALALSIQLLQGAAQVRVQANGQQWTVASTASLLPSTGYRLSLAPPPRVAVFGAGPETPALLSWLRQLGWIVTLVERRARWLPHDGAPGAADALLQAAPGSAATQLRGQADAALVMHHNFELDREALEALATHGPGFIGLLGPARRREDLFRVLPQAAREALLPRLRSPVGLDLGGQGAEAIALSIAAQLQAWRHGRP